MLAYKSGVWSDKKKKRFSLEFQVQNKILIFFFIPTHGAFLVRKFMKAFQKKKNWTSFLCKVIFPRQIFVLYLHILEKDILTEKIALQKREFTWQRRYFQKNWPKNPNFGP
jgi:hypothetical protein